MSLTVNQIAKKLNVSRDIAYGFIRFCEATKILRPCGKELTGERGKPAYQYVITDEDLGALAGLLASLMESEAAPTETPAEATSPADAPAPTEVAPVEVAPVEAVVAEMATAETAPVQAATV